jgi:FixJ family two-component response regulator
MKRSGRRGGTRGQPSPDEAPLVAIVDDDASVRQSTRRLIRSFGYRAEAFGSGEEFLSSACAAQTACVVLDVRMPGMDGLEVQRLLTKRDVRIPIVFLTGRASDDEERRARSAGAVAFLRKPVGKATLLQVLQKVFHEEMARTTESRPGDEPKARLDHDHDA